MNLSESPKLAAEVPNAIAETYLAVQQAAKSQSDADATQWLEPEIADLGRRVKEAESKVAAFRSHSDLLVGQNNSVLATQQLSELSTELSRVRANRSAAEATAEGVRAALKNGASLDSMPEVMSSRASSSASGRRRFNSKRRSPTCRRRCSAAIRASVRSTRSLPT